jgi:hypothetical protein
VTCQPATLRRWPVGAVGAFILKEPLEPSHLRGVTHATGGISGGLWGRSQRDEPTVAVVLNACEFHRLGTESRGARARPLFAPGFWDRTFTLASPAGCTAGGNRYTYENLTTNRAWHLPRGALACAVDADGGPLLSFDVFFDPTVDSPTALAVVSDLLPADAQQLISHELTNGGSKYPKYPQGSCHEVIFSSDELEAAIANGPQTANIDQQDKVSVTLYSGNELGQDGADQPYQPESIHLASVVQGDGSAGSLGVAC